MKWDATAKLTGSAEVNYIDKNIRERTDQSLVGYEVNLAYKATRRLTLVVSGSRGLVETNFLDGDSASGPTYDLTTLALTADYRFLRKTSLTGQVGVSFSDFNGLTMLAGPAGIAENRKDELVYAAIGIRHVLTNWMTMAVEVRRTENKSNVGSFDFREDFVSVSAAMTF